MAMAGMWRVLVPYAVSPVYFETIAVGYNSTLNYAVIHNYID